MGPGRRGPRHRYRSDHLPVCKTLSLDSCSSARRTTSSPSQSVAIGFVPSIDPLGGPSCSRETVPRRPDALRAERWASPSDERCGASRHAWRSLRVNRFDRAVSKRDEKELVQWRISFSEINDLGQRDAERIPILNVEGVLAGMKISKGDLMESPAESVPGPGIGRMALQMRPLSTSDILCSLAG